MFARPLYNICFKQVFSIALRSGYLKKDKACHENIVGVQKEKYVILTVILLELQTI